MLKGGIPLQRLVFYRDIIKDEVVAKTWWLLRSFLEGEKNDRFEMEEAFFSIWHEVLKKNSGVDNHPDPWRSYILDLILGDENVFSLFCERKKACPNESFIRLAVHDVEILKELYNLDWNCLAQGLQLKMIFPVVREQKESEKPKNRMVSQLHRLFAQGQKEAIVRALVQYYSAFGCGLMARYDAFRWKRGLVGIERPDMVDIDEIFGYEEQKKVLLENTEAFLAGQKVNNVLLYGEKGTGKSSSIKALLSRYAQKGLRVVELAKSDLGTLGDLAKCIGKRGFRFIIFIDDLSFEEFEVEYKHIKAGLEGSIEAIPENAVIYATSNRRNLVKESFKDRQNQDDEVHVSDSYQEKLSLVDRFGIVLRYPKPDQELYLKMVEGLAQKEGLDLPRDELQSRALRWARNSRGFSGRTAKQFIIHLMSTRQ